MCGPVRGNELAQYIHGQLTYAPISVNDIFSMSTREDTESEMRTMNKAVTMDQPRTRIHTKTVSIRELQ